jgi:hypothetical protein
MNIHQNYLPSNKNKEQKVTTRYVQCNVPEPNRGTLWCEILIKTKFMSTNLIHLQLNDFV